MHIVIAFSPAGKCYCSHSCRQTQHIIAQTPYAPNLNPNPSPNPSPNPNPNPNPNPTLTLGSEGSESYQGAPSMGVADVAPSDSTIKAVPSYDILMVNGAPSMGVADVAPSSNTIDGGPSYG